MKAWSRQATCGGDKFRINCISVTMHCCCLQPLINQCGFAGVNLCSFNVTGPGLPGLWRSGWLSCPEEVWLHGSGHSVRQRGPSSSPSDVINRRLVLEQASRIPRGLPAAMWSGDSPFCTSKPNQAHILVMLSNVRERKTYHMVSLIGGI